jgi:ribonuclease-3
MSSRLLSRSFLNQLSIDIGLDTFLETSADTSRTKSIFGDAFEALIGAIYLDKGYAQCKKFVVNKIIKDFVDIKGLVENETDFKSKLVERCQKSKTKLEFNNFELENVSGKYYRCELLIQNKIVSVAEEKSKKSAEQKASKAYILEKDKDSLK